MALKLFQVDVENHIMVLAETSEVAETYAQSGTIDNDLLDGADFSTREVEQVSAIDSSWIDAEPFISTPDYHNPENKDLINISCRKVMEMYEEENKKIMQKAESDKKQMKLDFGDSQVDEIDPISPIKLKKNVLCKVCGYSGPIYTYEPSMSVYSDCRCPHCGSTNNEHNSDYQTRLMAAMNNLGERAKTT